MLRLALPGPLDRAERPRCGNRRRPCRLAGRPPGALELLTSARAVEHQVLVLACNAAGIQEGVQLGGTSRVVDPAGHLVAEAGSGEEVLRVSRGKPGTR
ncbi:nitrilase-related carbon-nitrogen hydrolase [Arthrobacter sp. RHLT1-20]